MKNWNLLADRTRLRRAINRELEKWDQVPLTDDQFVDLIGRTPRILAREAKELREVYGTKVA